MDKFYLAAAFTTKARIVQAAQWLRDAGFEVVSRWQNREEVPASDLTPTVRAEYAQMDLEEVDLCDTLILFNEDPDGESKGGKDFEAGYAWASDANLVVIGGRGTVFNYLKEAQHFDTFADFMWWLSVKPDDAPSS